MFEGSSSKDCESSENNFKWSIIKLKININSCKFILEKVENTIRENLKLQEGEEIFGSSPISHELIDEIIEEITIEIGNLSLNSDAKNGTKIFNLNSLIRSLSAC